MVIGDNVLLDKGVEVIKKTFTDRKYLTKFACLLDIGIALLLITNGILLSWGSAIIYYNGTIDKWAMHLYLATSYALSILLIFAVLASIIMLIALRSVLAKRPTCLTDLCEPAKEEEKEDDDHSPFNKSVNDSQNSNDISFEIKIANNDSSTDLEKKINSDPY